MTINLTGAQIDMIRQTYEAIQRQTELLERIAVAVERIADNGGDTQRIDVETIRREARRVNDVRIGGGK
jgi:hypothetical protein